MEIWTSRAAFAAEQTATTKPKKAANTLLSGKTIYTITAKKRDY